MNSRPLEPHSSTLPSCATPRYAVDVRGFQTIMLESPQQRIRLYISREDLSRPIFSFSPARGVKFSKPTEGHLRGDITGAFPAGTPPPGLHCSGSWTACHSRSPAPCPRPETVCSARGSYNVQSGRQRSSRRHSKRQSAAPISNAGCSGCCCRRRSGPPPP